MKRKVWIAYTGGTIGMRRGTRGFTPSAGWLEAQLWAMPELHAAEMPEWDLHEYDPLLDSSDMGPADWLRIAKDLAERHEDYDGFVVIHGTDTMAYTASALPFMLPGLKKPVVITGSQIPLELPRSDGRSNLIASLWIAAHCEMPEVVLCFGTKLHRGCRATKVRTNGFEAFDSPNFPALGEIGIDIQIRWDLVRKPPLLKAPVEAVGVGDARVSALRLFPGISPEFLRRVAAPPMAGIVLEAYGLGNGPTRAPGFLDAIRSATDRGVVIVACSQCPIGRVDLLGYAPGQDLADAGVLSGHDMTIEAALAKLGWLLGQSLPRSELEHLLSSNLRGEISPLSAGPTAY